MIQRRCTHFKVRSASTVRSGVKCFDGGHGLNNHHNKVDDKRKDGRVRGVNGSWGARRSEISLTFKMSRHVH